MFLPSIYIPVLNPKLVLNGKVSKSGLPLYDHIQDWVLYINGVRVVVPEGFETDCASIPFGFRNTFTPNHPRIVPAALPHDLLYSGEYLPRIEADKIFLAILVYNGVISWKRAVMYLAVRLGGWCTYITEHTDETVENTRLLSGIYSNKRPLWNKIDDAVLWRGSMR